MLVVLAGLMLLEPHLSGTLLIFAIGFVMMFVGGTGIVWFVLAAGLLIVGVAGAIAIKPDLVWYAADRLEYWIDPWSDPLDKGHQVIQSMYAIGSGGLFGLGLGNSRQKHLYLPEPQNDFVFAIVCEELGFVGAMMVIFLFAALLWRGVAIARRSRDKFGAMLVVGIVTQVTVQAALNIAVVTRTIPNTGISLPFLFLRRHVADDAAGRDGHRPVRLAPEQPEHNLALFARSQRTPLFSCGRRRPLFAVSRKKQEAMTMRVLIAAGGTAGHINPALAIASVIEQKCPGAEIHSPGAKKAWSTAL